MIFAMAVVAELPRLYSELFRPKAAAESTWIRAFRSNLRRIQNRRNLL